MRKKIILLFIFIVSIFILVSCKTTKTNQNIIEKYIVSFDTNGGSNINSININANEKIEKPSDPVKTGYIFQNWYKENSFQNIFDFEHEIIISDITLYAKWIEDSNIKYTVNHYQQNIDNNEYTLFEIEEKYGTTNQMTDAKSKKYGGFTTSTDITQKIIQGDGSTSIDIFYDREMYSLVLINNDSDKGSIKDISNLYKYYQEIELLATAKEGYLFDGWYDHDFLISNSFQYKFKMPSSNIIYTAKWKPAQNTKYIVKHYQENIYNDSYMLVESENLTGTTDTLTAAKAKNYIGFEKPTINQELIKADGSTIINIYYNREKYNLTLINDNENAGKILTNNNVYKYGTNIKIEAQQYLGYTFKGWFNNGLVSNSITYNFNIESDITLTAKWTANKNTSYKVCHYLIDLSENTYELIETDHLTGETGTLTAAEIKSYEGYNSPASITQKIISGAGNTEISIYYEPKTYQLKVIIDNENAGSANITSGNYKYTSKIKLTTNTNSGYTFDGWYNGTNKVDTNTEYTFIMPAENLTLTARWTANTNTKYSVKHYLKALDSNTYELLETEVLYGTTANLTEATAKVNDGYYLNGSINQQYIKGDGTTVIELYYLRNTYKLILNKNISNAGTVTGTSNYQFDKEVTITAITNPGYTFLGWYENDSNISIKESFTFHMPANQLTYTAKWKANNDTLYYAKHYKQNIYDDKYTLEETEELYGTTGMNSDAKSKNYVGFNSPTITQAIIKGDNSTIINIYYSRIAYSLYLSKNLDRAGIISTNSGIFKYETEIDIIAVSNPGYTFNGWYKDNNYYSDSLSFKYILTSNTTFEARWTANKYNLTIVNNASGVIITGATSGTNYDCGNKINLTASNIPTDKTLLWRRSDNSIYRGDVYTFNMTPQDIIITIEITDYIPPYTREGNIIYFGSYPQSKVTSQTLISELQEYAGSIPTEDNYYNWIDYGYKDEKGVEHVMFYQDIDYNNDGIIDYRGIYIAKNRYNTATYHYPATNGYYTGEEYWFKYETIKWKILEENNNKVLIITDRIIDSQPYCMTNTQEEFEHNGGIGYSNNYELSDIRKWINETFYNTAFNELQQQLVETTLVKNDETTTEKNYSVYVCNDTNDKIFLLSYQEAVKYKLGQSYGNSYTASQCLHMNQQYSYCNYWLRTPISRDTIVSTFNTYVKYVCYDGGYYSTSTTDPTIGVRPACWINLS